MEFIGIVVFVATVLAGFAKARENAPERETLCLACVHAHVVRDFKFRNRLIRCTFGGVPQHVKFAVADCSMFCTRQPETPVVRVVGFAENEISQPVSPPIAAKAPTE